MNGVSIGAMKKLGEKKLRLFFACWPDAAEQVAMAAWQPALRELCGGREMRADTLHATLVFLGGVAEHRLQALLLAAREVNCPGFELILTTVQYWGHNHIAYAAPDDIPPQLAELVGELEQSLRRHRFHFDARPYKPHVTLLRNAQWSDARLPAMTAVRWRVAEFALVQSLNGDEGARYEVLARFPLRKAA